jgi:hypothetical protein
MADTWKSIFNGTIENRPVEIEVYDEGGYRIHTTQGADDPGTIESDDTSTLIIPPTEQGRKITIEGETADEIRNALLTEGFSEATASEIIGKLSA